MIDTATIVLIDKDSKRYWNIIKERDKAKRKYPTFIDEGQKDKGVVYTAIHKEIPNRPTSYVVLAKLTMRKLMDDAHGIALATEEDYPRIEKKLEALLKDADMPSLSKWIVNRVDFSYNLHTEHVDLYLKLLKCGIKPRYYRDLYIQESGKYEQREGSLYLVPKSRDKVNEMTEERRTGPKVINLYNKHAEMIAKGVLDPELLEQAKDVLRLEVQCFSPRLRAIRKRDDLPDMTLRSFFRDDIATEEIYLMVKKIAVVDCPYYTKDKAIQLIQTSQGTHSNTKSKLVKVVKALAKEKKKEWILEDYAASQKKESWQSCIRGFKSVNVNPVTISKRDSVGLKMLPSILSLFKEACLSDVLAREEALEAPQEEPEEKEKVIEPWSAEEIDMLFADVFDD